MDSTPDTKIIYVGIVVLIAVVSLLYCTLDYYGLCSWQWHDCCCCCYYIDDNGDRVRRGSNRILPESSDTSSS